MIGTFLRSSARLAWRDLRGSPLRAAFIAGAIAVSVGTIAAVDGASGIAREMLGRDSRVWLAGDLAVDTTEPVGDDQRATLDNMRREGIEWTMVTWTLTVASSDRVPDPVFTVVKAIDPAIYPFYSAALPGSVRPLNEILRPDTVAVSDAVLERLDVRIGDPIQIGGKPFTITAVIAAEPERSNGVLNWGLRCNLSRAGFERIAAAAAGNSFTNRILLRVPHGAEPAGLRGRLQQLFPEGRVLDYREAAEPEVARLELVISFMSVVAFLVLTLGAVGAAAAVRLNLEERTAMLAILRINGARTVQMASVFLIGTAALTAGGLLLGIPLGWQLQAVLLRLAGRYLPLGEARPWYIDTTIAAALASLTMAAPLLAGPANTLCRLRPLAILRKDVPESRSRLPLALLLLAGASAVAFVSGAFMAHRMIASWNAALLVVAAVAASSVAAWVATACLLKGAAVVASLRIRSIFKHALRSLARSQNWSRILIVCQALAVMILGATFESGQAVVRTVSAALPYPDANLVIADFQDTHRATVRRFLEQQPGVERVQMLTETWLRLAAIDGMPVSSSRLLVRCAEVSGSKATLADDLAGRLGVHAGSDLKFETRHGAIHAVAGEIHHPSPEERFWYTLTVDCSALPQSSLIQIAAVRVGDGGSVEDVRRATNRQFPTLAAIPKEELQSTIRGVTDDALALVRVITWSAIVGGLLILAIVVAASSGRRTRELGILSALGATRATVFKLYSLEFVTIGLLSGLIGGVLASGLNSMVMALLFHRATLAWSWTAFVGAVLISPLLTTAAGWLPIYHLLRRKPFDVLRCD